MESDAAAVEVLCCCSKTATKLLRLLCKDQIEEREEKYLIYLQRSKRKKNMSDFSKIVG